MVYEVKKQEHIIGEFLQQQLRSVLAQLFGVGLMALSFTLALALMTYSPSDPSIFTASDRPVHNWLGRHGATVASALIVVLGAGAWSMVVFLAVWGTRFVLGKSAGSMISSSFMIPVVVVLASILCATAPESLFKYNPGGFVGDVAYAGILNAWWGEATAAKGSIQLWLGALLLPTGLSMLGFPVFSTVWNWFTLPFQLLGSKKSRDKKKEPVAFGEATQTEPDIESPTLLSGSAGARQKTQPEPKLRQSRAPSRRRGFRGLGSVVRLFTFGNPRAADTDAIRNREPPALGAGKDTATPIGKGQQQQIPGFEKVVPPSPPKEEPTATSRVFSPVKRRRPESSKSNSERHPALGLDVGSNAYQGPPLRLLKDPAESWVVRDSNDSLEQMARMLESVLEDYGVRGKIGMVRPGPVVTLYQLEPAPGVKTSRVIGLADDIARSMSALSARISTVPGESFIGIELPNSTRETVYLRELVSKRVFGDAREDLLIALGKNIGGDPVMVDLAKMPHLLIAGTTGSGKSVAINTMILSLLYRLGPEKCRLIMIDPKMLELSIYDGIPHLLAPVVTDPKKAVVALKWVVAEMEERYREMAKLNVRNITSYNGRMSSMKERGECYVRTVQTGVDKKTGKPICETERMDANTLPYIVVIVDEMADLMMVAGKEIEACVQRLAQMARAAGIHIIMATQRPSVDVITGTIKSNFPARISFQVSSKIDSRTILNEQGAEQLLGMGDMLYMAGGSKIERVHGPFVSDREVETIASHLKAFGEPNYDPAIIEGPDEKGEAEIDAVLGLGRTGSSDDEAYDQAVSVILRDRRVSVSYIQRKLSIGYNKAARLVERMEEQGLVSKANHVGKREILVPE